MRIRIFYLFISSIFCSLVLSQEEDSNVHLQKLLSKYRIRGRNDLNNDEYSRIKNLYAPIPDLKEVHLNFDIGSKEREIRRSPRKFLKPEFILPNSSMKEEQVTIEPDSKISELVSQLDSAVETVQIDAVTPPNKVALQMDEKPAIIQESTPIPTFEPHFDRKVYDFMIAEGIEKNATTLAVISYESPALESEPEFRITFDRNQWFTIGEVLFENQNKKMISRVTIQLKANANVSLAKTKKGVYKFTVEAKQGNMFQVATIMVEVLPAMAPTTLRPTTTTAPTTTILPLTEKASTTTASVIEQKQEDEVLQANSAPKIDVPDTDTSKQPVLEGSGQEKEEEAFITEHVPIPIQTGIEHHHIQEHELQESDETVLTNEDEKIDKNDANEIQESIDNAIAAITQSPPEKVQIPIDYGLVFEGADNGIFINQDATRYGDMIRKLKVKIDKQPIDSQASLTVEPEGVFEIRPKTIEYDDYAALFIANPVKLQNITKIEVVAKLGNTELRAPLTIQSTPKDDIAVLVSQPIKLENITFEINDDAEDGMVVGELPYDDLKIVSQDGRFNLKGKMLSLNCKLPTGCFDLKKQKTHYVILVPNSGELRPIQIAINVKDVNNHRPSISPTDKLIRIADGKLIMPFGIEIIDDDILPENRDNKVEVSGDATTFLKVQQIDDRLYEVKVMKSVPNGHYTLSVKVTDDMDGEMKDIKVFVANSHSYPHFRKSKYEASIKANEIKEGEILLQLELEGVPIDEADIVILNGNPGWIDVENYGGKVKFDKFRGEIYSDKYSMKIGAVSKSTGKLMATTFLEISVTDGMERTDVFAEKYVEKILDRESATKFVLPLKLKSGLENAELKLNMDSILAIDENGMHRKLGDDEIKLVGRKLVIKRDIVKDLRLIMAEVTSGPDKVIAVLQLTSSVEYREMRRKEKSRPKFPNDIKEFNIDLPEERPSGYVVAVLPAIHPKSQKMAEVKMAGDMSGAFKYDQKSGALMQIHRIDYESLSDEDRKFELVLTAKGEEGVDSELKLKFTLTNIDDEPPSMALIEKPVEIPENLPQGEEILRIPIFDSDGVDHLNVELTGLGSENYEANIDNDTIVITTSEDVNIDRELIAAHQLILTVTDRYGNINSMPVIIHIKDINDNIPMVVKDEYKVTMINNWPENLPIEKIEAKDLDVNSKIFYHLNDPYFKINPQSGEIRIAKDLMGFSTNDLPYVLNVTVTDNGEIPLSTSVLVKIEIKDVMKEELKKKPKPILEKPEIGEIISIDENTLENTIIFKAKAHLIGGTDENAVKMHDAHLKYMLEDPTSTFAIDESTGEIFVKGHLDFEKRRTYPLMISAYHHAKNPDDMSSRLAIVELKDIDDNPPEFALGAIQSFTVEPMNVDDIQIGKVTAKDEDSSAFNSIFYYLLPKCSETSSDFSIDKKSGEIFYKSAGRLERDQKFSICILASSNPRAIVDGVDFDAVNKSMTRISVNLIGENSPSLENLSIGNNTISLIDGDLKNLIIPMDKAEDSIKDIRFALDTMKFIPASYEKGRHLMSPDGAIRVNEKTGAVSVSESINDRPEGVYQIKIDARSRKDQKHLGHFDQQIHFIRDAHKQRYVFGMPPNKLGLEIEEFEQQLENVFDDKDELDFHMGEIKDDKRSANWSTTCFYLTKNGMILDVNETMHLFSRTMKAGNLPKLHNHFKIISMESCVDEASSPNQSALYLPRSTVLIIAGIALLLLILTSLCIYICFVARYRKHLDKKEAKMKGKRNSQNGGRGSPSFLPPHMLPPHAASFY